MFESRKKTRMACKQEGPATQITDVNEQNGWPYNEHLQSDALYAAIIPLDWRKTGK